MTHFINHPEIKAKFPMEQFKSQTGTNMWYKEITNYVVSHERNNFDKITLYATGRSFWHCTENSALILWHQFRELLYVPKDMKSTMDYSTNRARVYYAFHISRLDGFKEEVRQTGFEILRDDDAIFCFQLKQPVRAEELSTWRHEGEVVKETVDALLFPNHKQSGLFTAIRELMDEVLIFESTDKGETRRVVTERLLDEGLELYMLYLSSDKDRLKKMNEAVVRFACFASMAFDAKLMNVKRAMQTASKINQLRKELAVAVKEK